MALNVWFVCLTTPQSDIMGKFVIEELETEWKDLAVTLIGKWSFGTWGRNGHILACCAKAPKLQCHPSSFSLITK
jgi:hypothetical protein